MGKGEGRVQERGEDVGEGRVRERGGTGEGRMWERGGCGRGCHGVPPHARNLLPLMFVAMNDFVPENINCISFLVASPPPPPPPPPVVLLAKPVV